MLNFKLSQHLRLTRGLRTSWGLLSTPVLENFLYLHPWEIFKKLPWGEWYLITSSRAQTTEQPLTRLESSIHTRVLATLIHFVHITAFPQTRTSCQQQKRNIWNRNTCCTKHYSCSVTTWIQLSPKTKCKIGHSRTYCCILLYFTEICI